MRLLLLAPPGAGKGTQGVRLANHFAITHISSGDLLRQHLDAGDAIGRQVKAFLAAGDLVPDELMSSLVREPTIRAAAAGGFVLDGFPRTIRQARLEFLDAPASPAALQAVLFLDVPDEVLVVRLAARRRGNDDTEETIRHRLEVYHAETEPLVAFYEQRGLLIRVAGNQPIEDVTTACIEALAGREDPPLPELQQAQ